MPWHRRWAFFRAWWGGYFWLPCHHCGRPYGGHERGLVLLTSPYGGFATCAHRDCKRQVTALNAAFVLLHGEVEPAPSRFKPWRIAA